MTRGMCVSFWVMDYITQFKSDRLAFYDSFRADSYEDEREQLDVHVKRVEGSDKAVAWLFDNLGDKSITDAWSVASSKASQANRGLTYSDRNRCKNASKSDFWKNIEEFIVWINGQGFNSRRNVKLSQVQSELTK